MGYVIEGTWEEIKRHEAEFVGQRLRVTISPIEKASVQTESKPLQKSARRVSARGKYAGILSSSENFMRRKQEDIAREDRSIS